MLQRWVKTTYWPLVLAMTLLMLIGAIFIYSASVHDSGNYLNKYFIWLGLAYLVLFLTPLFGYRSFLSLSYLFYAFTIGLLLWVMFAGETRLGAQRWISLGSFDLQPSELAKIATIIALANYLGSQNSWEKQPGVILRACMMVAFPCFLIIKQPDLGTTLLFIPILVVLLLLWGIKFRYLIAAFLGGLATLPLLWFVLKPYQKQRILVFMDPAKDPLGSGYTAIQSKIAIGSGGMFGKGYLQGTQSQLQFVPEHHTDFIFCVIGEEWGWMGAMVVLALYLFLFRSAFSVMTKTSDMKAKLIVAGILITIFSQVFINIGMSIGMMPITGLTLPLISYGGSSLLTTSLGLGLILSVYKERSMF